MAGIENNTVFGEGFKLQTSDARAISDMQREATDVAKINYVGNPEGNVSANPSSLCHDPVAGDIYQKVSGTGNTGWELVINASVPDLAITPYIVDLTSPAKTAEAYTTIQGAIDQAVIDGATSTNPLMICLRPGIYTENLTFYEGINLKGSSYGISTTGVSTTSGNVTVEIIGEHIFSGSSIIVNFEDIKLTASGGDLFSTAIEVDLSFKNCYLKNAGNLFNFSSVTQTTHVSALNSGFDGVAFSSSLILSDAEFTDCFFYSTGISATRTGVFYFYNCTNVGPVILDNTNIRAYNTSFTTNTTDNITGVALGSILRNCFFSSNTVTTKAVGATSGLFSFSNLGIVDGVTGPRQFFDSASSSTQETITQGGIIYGRKSAIDYSLNEGDHYLGITDTSIPRAISINLNGDQIVGQEYIVKDESGGAATNNITITPNLGALIDGAATYVIDQDYGSVTLKFDGTNFFTTNTNKEGIVETIVGTSNRINLSGTPANRIINISSNYVGQATITTLGTVTTGTWNADVISEPYGGTNQSTYATGDILYASAANTLSKLSAGSNTEVLTLAGGVPTWAAPAGGGAIPITALDDTDSPYTVLSTDFYMSCTTTAGVLTVDLPDAPTTGTVYTVKDASATADTNNITVTTSGAVVNIDGATTYVMNTEYQSASFIFNGVSYEVF